MGDSILLDAIVDSRERTLRLVEDLSDTELVGPRLDIVNPLIWEIGHVAWFQEYWLLRHHLGEPPILANGDALYDSSAIAHDLRWDLQLPGRQLTIEFLERVRDRVIEALDRLESEEGRYFATLTLFHEDMHDEAFLYTRQTLGYPPPRGLLTPREASGPWPGDAAVPGGSFTLGSAPTDGFIFDNEKWAHPVRLEPFAIARAPVTQAEFAEFVRAGGYRERRHWSDSGWRWREAAGAQHPVYWRRTGEGFERRAFDQWVPLEPHRPVIHVCWHEAEAYCRFAGRRLPTEAEWEKAVTGATRTNLDGRAGGCVDVAAFPEGDSAFGCRQMLGNVWEWTASDFLPYPGFSPDPYRDYSVPWFGTHKVLRGGAWPTMGRLIRAAYRNFYKPDRRDVWAGFRTCAQ